MSEEIKTDEEILAEAEAQAAEELAAEEEARAQAEAEEAARLAEEEERGNEPPKKGSYQDRINDLTYKYRSTQRELDYYKDVVLGKKKSGGSGVNPPPAKPSTTINASGVARPKPDGFETVEDYEDALYGWYDAKRESKVSAIAQEENFKKTLSAFNEGAAPVRLEHPDFDEVTAHPVFTDSMRKAIFNMDNGALVAYELGKNPGLAEKVKLLSPEKQIYEMGKLERKLLLVQKGRTKSNTPDPFSPITGRATSKKDPDKMDIKEWMEWDKQRTMAKLKEKLGYKE